MGWALAVALPLALGSCNDETVNAPEAADPLFARYVAFGNSLTAGYQSGGINDSTQMESYAVILAAAMETDFEIPLLNSPGCPPPLLNIFTQQTIAPSVACALRSEPTPTRINNLAVPGAAIIDAFDHFAPDSDPNTLTSLLLGGRTPITIAENLRPTFVSVALGSNDGLGAALDGTNPGNPELVTPPDVFAARYKTFLDSLEAIGSVEGGVLIGLHPFLLPAPSGPSAPYFTPGLAWQGFELVYDAQLSGIIDSVTNGAITTLNTLDVAAECATAFVPFPIGGAKLAQANALAGMVFDSLKVGVIWFPPPVVLGCTDAEAIVASELAVLVGALQAYNSAIQQEALARDWAYFDPAPIFTGLAATAGAFRPFPAFDPTDPQHETQPFGFAVSRDGIHWNAMIHEMIAEALIATINDHYNTDL
jgi:lysophospholipase L1-like esterase